MSASEAIRNSRNFTLSEFSNCPDIERIDPRLIRALDRLRDQLGEPIHAGRKPDAFARLTGRPTSRHYAVGRLSDAGDVFPDKGYSMRAWILAQALQEPDGRPSFGGIGLYFDTRRGPLQPGPMLHLDMRPGPRVLWARDSGRYWTASQQPRKFWQVVVDAIEEEHAVSSG